MFTFSFRSLPSSIATFAFRRSLAQVITLVAKWIDTFNIYVMYIFWKFIQYTIHWDKTRMLKKFPSDKINVSKNALFFSRELQLQLLLLTCNYTSWNTWFISLKLYDGFPVFDFVSFLSNLYIFFNKKHGPWPLIFKFNKILENSMKSAWVGGWSSSKIDPGMNFLNLENRSYEYVVTFFQY